MKRGAVLCVLAGSAWAVPAEAGPALASRWLETRMKQEACLERAELSLKKSGFTKIEPTRESRYGEGPDYTVAIRCIAPQRIIIFIATGPDREKTDSLAALLFQNFDPARP
jgi:hypothetical protein